MISEPAKKLLVAQVATELSAHQTYMGISLYFTRQSLNGWAKFFHEQAVEEAGHGWKIINSLVDNEVKFSLPQVGAAPTWGRLNLTSLSTRKLMIFQPWPASSTACSWKN